MAEFDAHRRRYQFDAQRQQHAFDARKRRLAFDAQAPSEVQEDTGPTVTLVDDFEDGDISEYQYDTGSFSVQNTVVKEGSLALRIDNGTNQHISSFPGDGLPYYPEAGDTFRWWGRTSVSEHWILLYFGSQKGTGGPDDRPDGYATFLNFANSEFILRKRESNTNYKLASTPFNYSLDTWYDVEIQWGTDGTIVLRLLDSNGNELASVSATDTTFTSGGITWQTEAQAGPKYMDYVRKVA